MTIYMISSSLPDAYDGRYRTSHLDDDYGYFTDKEAAEEFAKTLQDRSDQHSKDRHRISEVQRKAQREQAVKEICVLIENGLRTFSALPGPFEERPWHREWDSIVYATEAIEPHQD